MSKSAFKLTARYKPALISAIFTPFRPNLIPGRPQNRYKNAQNQTIFIPILNFQSPQTPPQNKSPSVQRTEGL